MKPVLITLIIVVGLLGLANIGKSSMSPKQVIYEMCQSSRITDMVSEQTCGELQDRYNAEYLCDSNNKNASTHCWVEMK